MHMQRKIYIQLILEFIDNLDLNPIYSVIIKIYYFLNHFYTMITRTYTEFVFTIIMELFNVYNNERFAIKF